jgi:hypothetical protein
MCIHLACMTVYQWNLIPFDCNLQKGFKWYGLIARKTSGHRTEEDNHPSLNSRKEVHQV